jgi:hypothetical protein
MGGRLAIDGISGASALDGGGAVADDERADADDDDGDGRARTMESHSSRGEVPGVGAAGVVVLGPHDGAAREIALTGERVRVGRLPDVNELVLEPDPERLVTRVGHCAFEREGGLWFIADGGSVNGTFLRRGGVLQRLRERVALHDGDVVCVLASIAETGERRFFELTFQTAGDSQATRAAGGDDGVAPAPAPRDAHLSYDTDAARLVLVRGGERHELHIRAQAHRLVRYMAERNAAAGGTPTLCAHDELMRAVWADEPLHSRVELARLIWELRRALAPFGAAHLVESERRLGYRLRTRGE